MNEVTVEQAAFLNQYTVGEWKFNQKTGLVDIKGHFDINLEVREIKAPLGTITGDFYCAHNRLTSLKGGPVVVLGNFRCSHNFLKSLEHAPLIVKKDFDCSDNILESLKNSPKEVGGNFHCYENNLESLDGVTRVIGADFNCARNSKLKSLAGCPEKVGRYFNCDAELVGLTGKVYLGVIFLKITPPSIDWITYMLELLNVINKK